MLEKLIHLDKELFIYLHTQRSEGLDTWMPYITNQLTWIPLFLAIVISIFYYQKKEGFWTIVAIVLIIVLADHTASSLFKPLIGRLRPCHDPELQSQVQLLVGCGGKYGFFSSHASNSFGMATFILLLLNGTRKWWSLVMFFWALLFSYSRIYLGKHFPLDILAGAIDGAVIGFLVYKLYVFLTRKYHLIKH